MNGSTSSSKDADGTHRRLHADCRGWSHGGSCTFVKKGDIIAAGQRIGLIRFGSRVDVYLPEGIAMPQVALGQRTPWLVRR